MQETYTEVGLQASWLLFAGLGILVAIRLLFRRKQRLTWDLGFLGGVGLLTLLRLPMEWVTGGGLIVGMIAVAIEERGKTTAWKQVGKIALGICCGVFVAATPALMYREQFTLSDSQAHIVFSKYHSSVPRSGLSTNVSYQSSPFSRGTVGYWTAYYKHEAAFSFSGARLYWGPHGLITGDQLGARVVEWSGQPVLDTTRHDLALERNRKNDFSFRVTSN